MCHFSFRPLLDNIQKHKKKKKDRDRDRDRERERDKDKHKERSRDKDKEREKDKERHRDKNRSSKHRQRSPAHNNSSDRSSINPIVSHIDEKPKSSSSKSVTMATAERTKCTESTTEKPLANESASTNNSIIENATNNKSPVKDCAPPQIQSPIKTIHESTQKFDLRESVDVRTTSTNPECISNSSQTSILGTIVKPNLPNSDLKVFAATIKSPITTERTPTEGAGIVIKKDYLPSPAKVMKIEKTRDDVTRVLNYESDSLLARTMDKPATYNSIIKKPAEPNAVTVKIEPDLVRNNDKSLLHIHKNENKENAVVKTEREYVSKNLAGDVVTRIKVELATPKKSSSSLAGHTDSHSDKKSAADKHSANRLSINDATHQNKNSASSSKSSSRRSSTSSSSRECLRCYKRSKIKRINTGAQCRRSAEVLSNMAPAITPILLTHLDNSGVSQDEALSQFKYARFFHVEVHSNGGASVVHMYQNEIDTLPPDELDELVDEYFQLVFSEDDNGFAHHVMGIVHDAAAYLPDLLEHMADNYSTLTVKAGVMGRNSDIETSTLSQYYEQVAKQYAQGTFRYGPLHQISLVGKVHEEVGGYFPDLLGRLEQSPFLNKVNISRFKRHKDYR